MVHISHTFRDNKCVHNIKIECFKNSQILCYILNQVKNAYLFLLNY